MPEEFRNITTKDWESVDEGTRKTLTNVYHMGMFRSSERHIYNQLKMALQAGYKQEDLIAVCMHVDEPLMPKEAVAACKRDNLEVNVFVSTRKEFAQILADFEIEKRMKRGKKRFIKKVHPYEKPAQALKDTPPPGHVYMAAFGKNACTVSCFGFDVEKSAPAEAPVELPAGSP